MQEKTTKVIIVCSLCLSFVVSSIMFSWAATRRSAQDVAIIHSSDNSEQIACLEGGGQWTKGPSAFVCRPGSGE